MGVLTSCGDPVGLGSGFATLGMFWFVEMAGWCRERGWMAPEGLCGKWPREKMTEIAEEQGLVQLWKRMLRD